MSDTKSIGEMFGAGDVQTFMGLPACPDLSALSAAGAILGVPGVTPYASVGAYCADGPAAIRDAIAGYAANLGHVDFDAGVPFLGDGGQIVDCGDLPFDNGNFGANRRRLRDAVAQILDRGAVPILLGGDDSMPIPMFEAYAGRGRFSILQIDAHIDWRDEVQGERLGLSSGMRRASEMGHFERIVQVGMRGIGSARPQELRDAHEWGARIFTARDVARDGIGAALDAIPSGSEIVIALDADALDPSVLPAVIGRAPGGLSYWDVVELMEGAAALGRIAGFEIAEVMPARDVDGLGALVAARIVANVVRIVAQQAGGETP